MKAFSVAGKFLIFFLLGMVCLALCSWIKLAEERFFARTEPFFAIPVPVFSGVAMLRNDPIGKGSFGVSRSHGRTHKGIDLLAAEGQPVTASKSGRVTYSGSGRGYGLYVVIAHPDGLQTRYAHLSRLLCEEGAWVGVGSPVGLVGKTGNADDPAVLPHLHYEIRRPDDTALNPEAGFLDPRVIVR